MALRRTALASVVVAIVAALCTSCARSVDVSASDHGTTPAWVTDGLAAARRATPSTTERPDVPEPTTTVPLASTYQLPPEADFVAALAHLGLDATAASCIYSGINGTPLAATVGKLLTAATNPLAAATTPGGTSAASIDEGTQRQLLVALAPCLDTNMLLTVLAAVTSSAGGGSGLNALLTSVVTSATSGIVPKLDAAALARAAGINLSPAQIAALTQAIAAAQAAGTVTPPKIDLTKLDVSKLSQQQIVTLLAALVKGLTPAQVAQLSSLKAIDLKALDLDIDVAKLTNDEAGKLFVVLLPYISAALAPPGAIPPAGGNPGQVYIPPGTDLSAINPLNFITRDNMIKGLGKEYGIPAQEAGCIYDRVRVIDPRLIGEAFLGNSQPGAAQVALAFLSCVVSP
jgi:hypothetical protein